MMIKTSFIFLLIVALNFDLSNAKLDNCPPKDRKEADECSRDVFFLMDPNFQAPTAATLPKYCEKVKMEEKITCIDNYGKKCLKGFTKQSLSISVKGFKKLHKQICAKNAPKKEEFLKKTAWMKKDDTDELYTCASGTIQNFKYINKKVDPDEQINQGCCNYWASRDCMDKKMARLTTPENEKFFKQLTDETMTHLIKFLCSKPFSLSECRKLMPKDLERMEKTINSAQKGKREENESFLIPFLSIIAE